MSPVGTCCAVEISPKARGFLDEVKIGRELLLGDLTTQGYEGREQGFTARLDVRLDLTTQ